jgi:hypothetical protein
MSRLKPYDVFQKPSPVQRRISVIRAGQWAFATIPADTFARETETQKFYLINEKFGLCTFNQNNPSKLSFRGLPGDYIAADPEGNLTIVTAKDYARKFPKARPSNMAMPLTSDDFLRENNPISVENSTSTDSNSAEVNTPTRY